MRYAKSIRNLKSENQTPSSVLFKVQETETLPIASEYITLSQFLKAVNVISTGGEAKFYLSENMVKVNGEPEQRRGRKLRPGDFVAAPGAVPTRLISTAEVGDRGPEIEDDAEAEPAQNLKSETQKDGQDKEADANAIQNPKSKIQNGTAL